MMPFGKHVLQPREGSLLKAAWLLTNQITRFLLKVQDITISLLSLPLVIQSIHVYIALNVIHVSPI